MSEELNQTTQNSVRKSKPIFCVVTSDKMDKSRVGTVEKMVRHDRYGKFIKRRTKIMFHDEKNETKIGDSVLIEVTRPLSSRKHFRLKQVIETGR